MLVTGTPIAVWTTADGVPERIVWRGRRYRVTDTPTLLDSPDVWFATHPTPVARAWRFQGTADDRTTRIFDVRFEQTRGEWQLLHLYE